jgi:hypothetical protein
MPKSGALVNTQRHQLDGTNQPDAGPPTVAEVAALLHRLRNLSAAGPDADPAARARFLADKAALLARIPDSASGQHDRQLGDAAEFGSAR